MSTVATYQSQWRLFFSTLERWRAALWDYARAQGRNCIGERRWRLGATQGSLQPDGKSTPAEDIRAGRCVDQVG
jgi:hypothetical protein